MHFMKNNAIFQTTAVSFPEAEMWLAFAEIQVTLYPIHPLLQPDAVLDNWKISHYKIKL